MDVAGFFEMYKNYIVIECDGSSKACFLPLSPTLSRAQHHLFIRTPFAGEGADRSKWNHETTNRPILYLRRHL